MIQAGTIIDGRYHVLSRVGSGGMADVYLAEDQLLGRRVAVKLLHHRFSEDQEFVERFRREASSAAALSHPNVVGVFDRGEWDGTYYIAMEYLPGRSLKALVRERGALEPAAAIDVIVQVLRAARFAHRRGVIHRDIKPHNVILDEEGRAKVTDFGIARAGASDMTLTGSIMGTAQYLSPEQAQGQAVSESSDLYAIGVVLYELLAGTVPFDGDSAVAIALKQVSAEPRPPSERNPAVPLALDAIVARALAKDPAARFPDADQFIAALVRVRRTMPDPVAEPEEELAREGNGAGGDQRAAGAGAGLAAAAGAGAGAGAGLAAAGLGAALAGTGAGTGTGTGAGAGLAGERLPPARVQLSGGQAPPPGVEANGATVPTEERKRLRRRRRLWWVAAGVLAAIALAAGAVALLTPATSVRVPEVRNRTEAQALEIIHRRGLQATVASAPSNWFAPGIVITQEPLPGDFLAGGARVRIVVSRGPGSVLVPAVGGYTETRARATLRAAGLTVGVRTGASNVEGRGLVISTSPSPNARVAHGSRVTVLVSTGPEAVLAPTLVGKSLAEAEGALEQAGLKVGAVRHQRSSQAEAGTVLSQSPGAGASVHVGAVVDLVVAQAPSRPPSHASSAVPSVVGQPAGQARAALREAGFSVRRATRRVSNPALVGLVVQQSPPAGEPAQSHSTVTITVGVAGHTPGTTTTTTTTPSPTTTPTTTTTTSTTTSAVPPAAAAPGG